MRIEQVIQTMDNPTIRHIAVFAVLAIALTLSIGIALAEEDIFGYQGDYKIDTAKLSDKENTAYPYIQKYAEERHISPALLMAMVKQESGFNPNAIGDGGLAIGYMQVHWDAAYDAGYRSVRSGSTEDQKKLYAKEDWPTDGLNPDTNIKYGSGYLKIVYDQWKDSSIYNDPVKNAISAYNKGRTLGPDLGNQASYVDPILTYCGNYGSKYVGNPTPTTTPNPSSGEVSSLTMPVKNMQMEYTDCPTPFPENFKYSVVWTGNYNSGCEGTGLHLGVDIPLPFNTPVYAIADGTVTEIQRTGVKGTNDFGVHVVLKHDIPEIGKFYSVYAHLKSDSIPSGIETTGVKKGNLIGCSGNTGYTLPLDDPNRGYHLHFQIEKNIEGSHPYLSLPDLKTIKERTYNPIYFIIGNHNKWEFNTPGDNESWSHHNIDAWSVETDGKFRIDPGPTDPWIDQPYISLDSTFYNTVNINMASNAPDRVGAIYFTTSESSEFSEDKKVDFDVSNDGDWHDYSIFMGSQPMWTGTITGIRIDPADYGRKEGEVDSIGFDYIRVEHSHIILDQSIYPNVASAGDQLTFVFNIDNSFSNDIEKVRLGARIRTHDPQGEWIDDMPNDNTITLKPGANVYSRVFKTPADLSDGLYDAEWVVMDEGTKRWIDHEDMCPILTISSGSTSNPTPTSQPTSAPTAVQTGAESPTPTDDTDENNVIEVITSVVKETINRILDLLEKLL